MIEARVVCKMHEYTIEDLNITLSQGDEIYLSESRARESLDLRAAKRAGALRVEYVERYTMAKPPMPPKRHMPPAPRMSRPGFAQDAAPKPTPTTQAPLNEDALAAALAKALEPVVAEMQRMTKLLQGMQGMQGTAPRERPQAPVTRDADEPVFIPSGLVKGSSGKVSGIQATASEDTGLDEAAAALKASKKRS